MKDYKYKVILKNIISLTDQKILTYLYLPIIGTKANALYQFLVSEYEVFKELKKMEVTTQRVLKNLNISFDSLESQCKKLEAIGLLEILQNDTKNSIIFNVYAPLEAGDFFNDKVLVGLLLKKISSEDYDIAKFTFRDEGEMPEDYGYVKRTTPITEVFEEIPNLLNFKINNGIKSKPKKTNLILKGFSYNEVLSILEKNKIYITKNSDTMKLIETIYATYKLSVKKICELVVDAFDFQNLKIEENRFFAMVDDYLNKNRNNNDINSFNPEENIIKNQKQKIYEFEHTDPIEYLKLLLETNNLSDKDKDVIDTLHKTYNIRNGVINTLLDFSYLKNDTKIIANYLYKIAATFRDLNIKTADKAMSFLKTAFRKSNNAQNFQSKKLFLDNGEYLQKNIWNDPQDDQGYKLNDAVDEKTFEKIWR